LHHIFGFIGLTDVTFIHAENQAREEAGPRLAVAAEEIGRLAVEQASKLPIETLK
jgi:FMN-dependent NADH-azoreductase